MNSLNSVAYGNNLYVIAGTTSGNSGIVLTSSDGITWTTTTLGTTNTLVSVTYGNHLYIVVGNSGTIYSSSDGITWTSRTSGTANSFYSVTYGNNQYIAVGSNGIIYSSLNGITWSSRTSGTTNGFWGINFGNSQFVAVGDSGRILTSPSANAISYTAPKLNYSVIGATMQIYSLQGKLIARKNIESENYFDGRSSLYKNMSKGMYIVRIPTGNAVISRRVLVE